MKSLIRFWRDQRGAMPVVATVLLYTVLILGATAGLVTLRNQLVQEFGDLAAALQSLDQSFHIDDGASYTDSSTASDPAGEEPAGLNVRAPSRPEGR